MLLMKKILDDSQIIIREVRSFDENVIEDAKLEFDKFLKDGIIIESSYEDMTWYLYNECQKIRLSFDLNEKIFNEECSFREIGNYSELINAIKFYILYRLNFIAIASIRGTLNNIKKIFLITRYFKNDCKKELLRIKQDSYLLSGLPSVIEILQFYDINVDSEYFEIMHSLYENFTVSIQERKGMNQREIGNLESVFKFGDILDDFWNNCSIELKEKYYPIKIWWELTTIIPLRTTEFTLIPYDCLIAESGEFYIRILRSNIKGVREKTVTHKIDKDYKEYKLRINSKIYDLIEGYKNIVDHYDFEKNFYFEGYEPIGRRKFLFSRRSYFKNLKDKESILIGVAKKKSNLEYLTAMQMDYLLDCFYNDIIHKKYNYQLLAKDSDRIELKENEIELLTLMDTRHYAFINLVLNEVEPMVIKEISGHNDINSSYHYYNHVNKFIKCYTYSMAKKIALNKKSQMNISIIDVADNVSEANQKFERIFGIDASSSIKTAKGGCTSKQIHFEDCLKVDNDCELCDYAILKNNTFNEVSKLIEDNNKLIAQEVESLKNLLKYSKKVKDLTEKQQLSLNQIKAISNQNSKLMGMHIL